MYTEVKGHLPLQVLKEYHHTFAHTSPNADRFSKLFYHQIQEYV